MTDRVELLPAFKFTVHLTRTDQGPTGATLGTGGFAECSGLELEADVKEYLEGGRNDGVVRRVGRVKLVPIVLKRGMFRPLSEQSEDTAAPAAAESERADSALWDWITGMVAGTLPVPRYNGLVELHDATGGGVLASWTFERGLPSKVTGPTLNARTGEIAVEELHVVHEGLRLGGAPT